MNCVLERSREHLDMSLAVSHVAISDLVNIRRQIEKKQLQWSGLGR